MNTANDLTNGRYEGDTLRHASPTLKEELFPVGRLEHVPGENKVDSAGNGFDILMESEAFARVRGPLQLPDGGGECVGRVGCPPSQESTSTQFFFWVPEDALVEANQIVTVPCHIAGKAVRFYAIVEEVHRSSRTRGMGHEVDVFDGDLSDEPPFASEGITYGKAAILRTEPGYLTPPRERSHVLMASPNDAQKAYGSDEIKPDKKLAVGLIQNGGEATAGPGFLDLDYLLGTNGGHLNVSGAAGRATKSSFLLTVLYALQAKAEKEKKAAPSAPDRLRIVPIIFNVKNFDLFYLDHASRDYRADSDGSRWAEMEIEQAGPFAGATFFAPQAPGGILPIDTGRRVVGADGKNDVKAYSWALGDVIRDGLFPFLFSDEDNSNDNFMALVYDMESLLTHEKPEADGEVTRSLSTNLIDADNKPVQTFKQLADWLRSGAASQVLSSKDHHEATRKKLSRRLMKLLYESRGVLRTEDKQGNPLRVVKSDTCGPIVIDLNGLAGQASLQRFVVATVLRQLVESRTGTKATRNLKYLVTLDELNRFAPAGGRDPITRLIETVAGEMRSQGILLFGAQQQASLVSGRVIENSAIKVLGQTGTQELRSGNWAGLSDAVRRRVTGLLPGEKIIMAPGFRQPMHVSVPRPAWAMNREEALPLASLSRDTAPDPIAVDDLASFGDA